MSFMTCRVSAVLVLVFALPLAAEIREVLRLWLVTPPPFAAEICVAILLCEALQKSTDGYWMAILGLGRGVVAYSRVVCLAGFVFIAVCWFLFAFGFGMWSVLVGQFALVGTLTGLRLWIGRSLVGFSVREWLRRVCAPLAFLAVVTLVTGILPRIWMEASPMRVAVTTLLCELVFVPVVWIVVLERSERDRLRRHVLLWMPCGRKAKGE